MVQIRQVGPRIGVEISGWTCANSMMLDLQRFTGRWLDHNVMVVKGQELTIGQFLAYSRRFGIVTPHPSKSTRHPDMPEITLLGANKFRADGSLDTAIYRRGAEGWHTDGAYDEVPFKATQLFGLAIPDAGGDTLFASGYAAYDAMPERLRQRLEGVLGAFTYGGSKLNQGAIESGGPRPAAGDASDHPDAQRNRAQVALLRSRQDSYIEGAEPAESDDLIGELTALMIQPEGEYRHKWSVGDVVIWDNRCSYHRAAGDYPPEQDRIHWRTSIKEWPAGV